MKFKSYLTEIKNRLTLLFFSFLACWLTSYCYKTTLLFLSIKNLNNLTEHKFLYFISTNITEIVTTYFKLIYANSILLVSSLSLYHLLLFLHPALNVKEYLLAKTYFFKTIFYFSIGFLLLNCHLIPMFWSFFLTFQDTYATHITNIFFENKIEEYINLYLKAHFLLLIINQLFVVFILILNSSRNKIKFLKDSKKVWYLLSIILSTAITPPDVFSQLITFFGFFLFLETLIVFTLFKANIN